jgi:hypothetical protein
MSFLERTPKFAAEGAPDFDEPLPNQEKYRGVGVGPGGIPQGGNGNVNGLPVFARYRNNSSFSFSRRLSSVTASRIARRLQRIGNENAKPGRLAPAFHPALRLIDVGGMMIWSNSCLGEWWRRRELN